MTKFAVIGDVHGNALEFMRLLRRIEAAGVDAIYQVGDLVDRGPASVECVRIARTWTFTTRTGKQRQLRCLLGNHEENHVYAHYNRLLPGRTYVPKVAHPDVQAALTEADYKWLDGLPLWIGFTSENGRKWAIVHGGLPPGMKVPGWLGKNAASVLCRTGYLDEMTGVPLKPYAHSRRFWAAEYNGRWGHVFFGHTSFDKIRSFPNATGVDCSKMGKVAGVIVDTDNDKREEVYEPIGGWTPKKSKDDHNAYRKWDSTLNPKQSRMFDDEPRAERRAPPAPLPPSVVGKTRPRFDKKPDFDEEESLWGRLGIKAPFSKDDDIDDWSK